MRRVFTEIAREAENLKNHDAFLMVKNISSNEAVEVLKVWGPLFVHLTMTFRDINLMYNTYEQPRNVFEHAINGHAYVDAAHWEMLVADLDKIGVGGEVKNYKEAMRIMWSQQGEPVRDYIYWVLHRALFCRNSPWLKITAMESCEATVKMFLTKTSHISKLFESATGEVLHYFGDDHYNSEIDNAVDLSVFEDMVLDHETLTSALWIVNSHFENFKVFIEYLFVSFQGGKK